MFESDAEGTGDGDVVTVLAGIVAVDIASANEAQLGQLCRNLRRVRGYLDTVEAAAARRSEQLRRDGQGRGAETMLTRNARLAGREARRTIERAATLAEALTLQRALAAGAVSSGHVDAYTAATRRAGPSGRAALVAHEQSLAGLAATQSPEDFARSCQRISMLADDDGGVSDAERQRKACRLRRWIDHATGMYRLAGEVDPELGVRIWRAIDHTIATNYPPEQRPDSTPDSPEAGDHLAALALADLATAAMGDDNAAMDDAADAPTPADPTAPTAPTSPPTGRRSPCRPPRGEFTVIVDLATLVDGLHTHSIIETDPGGVPLPVATLRRLACEADILPVVLDGHGVTVDVGRAKRLATADQRRALRAMYPGCAIGGCGVEFDHCQIHHLDPFGGATGRGLTNLDQLIPVCSRHHHAAHEGRWQLSLDPTTRVLTVTLPDGTIHTHPPPRHRHAA